MKKRERKGKEKEKKKEETREIIDIKKEKDDGGKIIEDGEKPEKKVEEQIKKENEQLKKIFLIAGILALFFVGIFILINSMNHFTYKGIKFEIDRKTLVGKTIYKTSLPVGSDKKVTLGKVIAGHYNFYLRNDPRKLEKIPFDVEELVMRKQIVLNFTENFNCDGDGIIGVANLMNLMVALKGEPIKNESLVCDPGREYTFIQLQQGNETSIEQFDNTCYNLNINNCEVLQVTEKLMVEMLARVNEALEEQNED